MTTLAYVNDSFAGAARAEDRSFDSKAAAFARLKARQTTCTPEVLEAFADPRLPEVSGNLGKRFVWF